MSAPTGEVIVYQREDGAPAIEVRFDAETAWLSQQQIADLFGTTKQNISLHINNVSEDGELDPSATVKESLTVRQEGTRAVERSLTYYNLDVVISVGYRVKSKVATQFRMWATERLRANPTWASCRLLASTPASRMYRSLRIT